MNIRISEKHGVNPTVGVCFWCGEDDGTVGLLGKLPDDREAPQRACLSYQPCAACVAKWEGAIMVFEANTEPYSEGQPSLNPANAIKVYPSGRHVGLSREGVLRVFRPEVAEIVLREGRAFMDPEAFKPLLVAAEEAGRREQN